MFPTSFKEIAGEAREASREEIEYTVRAARDSVWVINQELQKLAAGEPWNNERKNNIDRNVRHLELVVSRGEIANSGIDLSDLTKAVDDGKQELQARQ